MDERKRNHNDAEHGPRSSQTQEIILVTPGLNKDSGGVGAFARLALSAIQGYCAQRGLSLKVWSLATVDEAVIAHPVRHFNGNQMAMGLALLGAALKPRPPLFFFAHLGPARVLGWLPGFLRAQYLLFIHGVEIWRALSRSRRLAVCNSSKRLCNSNYTRQRAYEQHAWLSDLHVLHLAREHRPDDGDINHDLLQQLGAGVMLIVGRLDTSQAHKGHDALLEALPPILASNPEAQLVIVGKGDDEQRLRAKAQSLGVASSVVFTGFVSDATLNALYAHCRVFAMPSVGDGFGFVYLEAMNHAKPCIALTVSSGAEIIVDGETGLLVPRDDNEALAAALLRFLHDPDFAALCGARGYQRLQQHFTFEVFEHKLQAHLDDLLHTRKLHER